jgi:hypothetical protein
MLNILAFAFYLDYRSRSRGRREPFLLGFQVAGWAGLLAYLASCTYETRSACDALIGVAGPVLQFCMNNLSFDAMKRLDPTFRLAHNISTATMASVIAAGLTAVLVLVAWLGGTLARWWSGARLPARRASRGG